MLLNSLEHLGARLAGVATVIYAGEKSNILSSLLSGTGSEYMLALKMSGLITGSEYLSDMLLSIVTNTKVPALYSNVQTLGVTFVSNALVLLVFEKLNVDDMIVSKNSSAEKKAFQIAILFIIVQEISTRVINMYLSR